MLIILSFLVPAVSAIHVFRMEDASKRRTTVTWTVFASTIIAVLAALFGGELTFLPLTEALALRFAADRLSLFFVMLDSLVWCLVQFHAFGYMKHEGKEEQFFGFFLLTYASLVALAFAKNAVTLYMCFEFMTLSSLPMVLHNGTERSREAAFKYLGYSTLGALTALLGFFLLAAQGNDLVFTPGGVSLAGDPKLLLAAAFLIILGFGAKAGMVPLQMWLTEAHPVAPSPASAVMSGVITKAGILCILRCTFQLFGCNMLRGTWVQTAVLTISIVTIFTGSMLAQREKVLKKRLAYSSVSNLSYVVFGLFTFEALGVIGAFLQVVFHALAKDALFLCAGSIIVATGSTRVDELRGVGKRMPATMWCFTLASLSLIGIPPFGGFAAKWDLALGALHGGTALGLAGVIVLMVSALLTAFYLLPIVAAAFFPGRDFEAGEKCEVPRTMLVPQMVFAGLTLLLGMFPNVPGLLFERLAEWLL